MSAPQDTPIRHVQPFPCLGQRIDRASTLCGGSDARIQVTALASPELATFLCSFVPFLWDWHSQVPRYSVSELRRCCVPILLASSRILRSASARRRVLQDLPRMATAFRSVL